MRLEHRLVQLGRVGEHPRPSGSAGRSAPASSLARSARITKLQRSVSNPWSASSAACASLPVSLLSEYLAGRSGCFAVHLVGPRQHRLDQSPADALAAAGRVDRPLDVDLLVGVVGRARVDREVADEVAAVESADDVLAHLDVGVGELPEVGLAVVLAGRAHRLDRGEVPGEDRDVVGEQGAQGEVHARRLGVRWRVRTRDYLEGCSS